MGKLGDAQKASGITDDGVAVDDYPEDLAPDAPSAAGQDDEPLVALAALQEALAEPQAEMAAVEASAASQPAAAVEAAAAAPKSDEAADPLMLHLADAVAAAVGAFGAVKQKGGAGAAAEFDNAFTQLAPLVKVAKAMQRSDADIAARFAQHGPAGDALLQAILEGRNPLAQDDAAKAKKAAAGAYGGGQGDGLTTVMAGIARLVAAPITLPIAAGSKVWQAVRRMGLPPVAMQTDATALLMREFDESQARAVEKISHLRSGPMNGVLSEMVNNPLSQDEQWQRMSTDTEGEYAERGQKLREAMEHSETRASADAVREALRDFRIRAQRLAAYGETAGVDVEGKLESGFTEIKAAASKDGVDIPMPKADGSTEKLGESIEQMVESIKKMLAKLFGRSDSPEAAA